MDVARAYAACEQIARTHYENFPVASLLVPKAMRGHIAAVYAFARAADDFADEGSWSSPDRHRLLDGWQARLAAAESDSPGAPVTQGEPAHATEIFLALGASIRELALPIGLFEDLLSAFRQDVDVTRYATWHDVLDYCRRSANPVGRLVLRIAGYRDWQLDGWSDAICTALQLTNFWQDFRLDWSRGRLYVPEEAWRLSHATLDELSGEALPLSWRQALAAAAERTRTLFAAGRPLCDRLQGRLRYELRATWLGGVRILDGLESHGCDPMRHRPRLTRADAPWFAAQMLLWKGI